MRSPKQHSLIRGVLVVFIDLAACLYESKLCINTPFKSYWLTRIPLPDLAQLYLLKSSPEYLHTYPYLIAYLPLQTPKIPEVAAGVFIPSSCAASSALLKFLINSPVVEYCVTGLSLMRLKFLLSNSPSKHQ